MLKRCKWILVLVTVAIIFAEAKAADDANSQPLGVGMTFDYFSKYIWRGQALNDESVFQPSIYLSKYGFTAAIWGSMDMKNNLDNAGNFTEVDTSLDYTAALPGLDFLNFSVGGIYYDFPNTDFDDTTEVYVGVSAPSWPLTPSFKVYRDVDEIKGNYYQFGVGHTFEKVAKFSEKCFCNLVLGASVGYGSAAYNKGYFGVDSAQSNDLTLTAGLPICFGNWTLKPSINYATMLSDSIRSAPVNAVDSDNLWGGLSLATSF
jgi:hypothetical protein